MLRSLHEMDSGQAEASGAFLQQRPGNGFQRARCSGTTLLAILQLVSMGGGLMLAFAVCFAWRVLFCFTAVGFAPKLTRLFSGLACSMHLVSTI